MTHPVETPERGAFFYMDLLRYVAASLVVVEHLRDLTWLTWGEAALPSVLFQPVYFLTGFGSQAVSIFFVLSGFWITRAVERRVDAPNFWRVYLTDRLSRLLVVIVPALLIGWALDAYGRFGLQSPLYLGTSGALSLRGDIAARLDAATFLGNLAFLQTILVPTFGSNGPLWSLANEFWYYVWFPALLMLVKKRRVSLGLLALVVVAIGPHLLAGFAVWLAGSALYYLDSRLHENRARTPLWQFLLGAMLAGAVMSADRLGKIPAPFGFIAVGIAFAVFVWLLLGRNPLPKGWLSPLAKFGANSSYSLYVVHFPVLTLATALAMPQGRIEPGWGSALVLALAYLALVLFAWGFSRLTEAHTPKLRKLLSPKPPA